jgi:parvulin-like peptidyl-prolyl isomerase
MITRRGVALVVGAIALLLVGCSSAEVVATVDGVEIAESTVLGIRAANEGEASVPGDQFRSDLSRLIFTEALLVAAEEDFGLTGLDTPEAREAYLAAIPSQEEEFLASIAANPAFTEEAVNVTVTQLMILSEVRGAVAHDPELLEDVWASAEGGFIEVCASHILVASEEEALDVLSRLDDGQSFVDIANDVSLDEASVDGALPCPLSPTVFVAPFALALVNAPVGEVTDPVQTEFGWHVIVVETRESAETLEELSQDPVRWIAAERIEAVWTSWIDDAVGRADITVRSDIGTWFSPADAIVPPPQSP